MGSKKLKDFRPRLKGKKLKAFKNLTSKENRVLVIGDLHEPFCLDGYFEFCLETYDKYNCNKVVFIGDILDNHYSSYHETSADGLGGGEELDLAIKKLKKWYRAFPKADVTLGNHDIIIMRKAQTSNVPSKWIKEYKDVLETPNWNYVHRLEIDNVQYIHGIGSKAHIRCIKDMQSVVQGHHHTDCYVQWKVGANSKIFGMQVGCGIDKDAYAMAYGKWFPKPAIGCGVVIGGHTAFNVLMNL